MEFGKRQGQTCQVKVNDSRFINDLVTLCKLRKLSWLNRQLIKSCGFTLMELQVIVFLKKTQISQISEFYRLIYCIQTAEVYIRLINEAKAECLYMRYKPGASCSKAG